MLTDFIYLTNWYMVHELVRYMKTVKIIYVSSEINCAEGPTDMNIDRAFTMRPFCK